MHGRFRILLLLLSLLAITAVPAGLTSVAADAASGTIAYVRGESLDEIRLIDADGANDRRLWAHGLADPHGAYNAYHLRWRPDGSELAFISNHENICSLNNADVFVVGARGGGYRRITEAPACAALASYGQGRVEMPVRNSSSSSFVGFVYLQGAASAQALTLPPGGSGVVTFERVADFGPGALQVAAFFQGAQRYISVGTAVDVVAGGSVRSGSLSVWNLSMYNFWEAHSPSWRSDGSKIGYVFNYNGLHQLSPNPAPLKFGEPLHADQKQLPDFVDMLAWGPPSRANQLLYAGNSSYESEAIYLVTEGSSSAGTPLVVGEVWNDIRGLAWLPDGSGFVYSVAEEYGDAYANLFRYSFASGQTSRITNFTDEFAGALSVSPDGQQIVFERAPSTDARSEIELWIVNLNGSGMRRLATNAAQPAWSPRPLAELRWKAFLPAITR